MTLLRAGTLILVPLLFATVGCRCHRIASSPECEPQQDSASTAVAVATISDADSTSKTIVTMRLMDAHGPLGGMRCTMEVEDPPRYVYWALMGGTTDKDGRVSMPWISRPGTAHVQVWRGAEAQPSFEGTAKAGYETSPPPVLDLGEVRVVEAPLLLSGIVCTPRGEPVAGAIVGVHQWEWSDCVDFVRDEDRFIPGAYCDRGPLRRFRAVTDRSGRFAIRGSSGLPMLSIEAEKAGYPEGTVFFHPGDTHARVVLARGGAPLPPR